MKVAMVFEVDKDKGRVKDFKMPYQRDMRVSETGDLNRKDKSGLKEIPPAKITS